MSSLHSYLFTRIPHTHSDATAAVVLSTIRAAREPWDSVNYVYVEDQRGRLIGVFSIKELLMAEPRARIADLMQSNPVTIAEHTSPRRAVAIAIEHGLKAVPVVDGAGKLQGVVASDAMHQILHKTHVEDFLRSAGFTHPGVHFLDVMRARFFVLLKARFSWLMIGILGGMGAAWIAGLFEATLREEFLLTFFIPIVVYLSDAVGTQTETLFIRSLAAGTPRLSRYLWREVRIGLSLGAIFGLLAYGIVFTIWHNARVAEILGLTFFFSTTISTVVAVVIPWLFLQFRRDPATGSGPFATIIQDILSLTIYFLIATLIL